VIRAGDGIRTRIRALYGPNANVWGLFIYGYLTTGSVAGFGGMFAAAQCVIGQAPCGFWISGVDYREPTGVDIEGRSDASNDHGVGWTREGEWLVYTVEVKESGLYRLKIPVASEKEGGLFHIEMDGRDVTGPLRIPDTGSWQQLELLSHDDIRLEKGRHRMKVVMDENGESGGIGDFDLFRFERSEKG